MDPDSVLDRRWRRFRRDPLLPDQRCHRTGPADRAPRATHPGSQLALLVDYDYHTIITDRPGNLLHIEADHRRHAEIENAIRDLKHGLGLNRMPSGDFAANGLWLSLNIIAHNLLRWTARLGLREQLVITAKTLRRRFLCLPGPITRRHRREHLHLPARWPWARQFHDALARLRAIPAPT